MKTPTLHSLISKAIGIASEISAGISNMIALIVIHEEQPQRVRVTVRVDNNPLPYSDIH